MFYEPDYAVYTADSRAESGEECKTCPYKGKECRNQCERVERHYNPYLANWVSKAKERR